MASGRNPALEGVDSEGLPIVEGLVPTPAFSGKVDFNAPSGISFAPAATIFATPMTHGTLMADFLEEPRVLRDRDDIFPAQGFVTLVITVRTNLLQSLSLFQSFAHSGRVSKRSGSPPWGISPRARTISLVQSWHGS